MTSLSISEGALRISVFLAVFVILAVFELAHPRRERSQPRLSRWRTNLGILLIDVIAQRLLVGALAFGAALYGQTHGWGLFNALKWPVPVEAALGFLKLDLAIWAQHVASHRWPMLWRLHQVHHADLDVDLTTGIRFHPGEIVLSAVFKAGVVLALGIGPWTVVAFEAVLNASSLYTHANIALPRRIDGALRWVFCTPDMHRIHHSADRAEADTNYGFFLSVWDRLFGTMRADPAHGHGRMILGLAHHQEARGMRIGALLSMPFMRDGVAKRKD